jgi:hypothetical protein
LLAPNGKYAKYIPSGAIFVGKKIGGNLTIAAYLGRLLSLNY